MIVERKPPATRRRGTGRLHIELGGQMVTVYDGAVHTGVTLPDCARAMLVSHDLFTAMEQEVRDGKAKEGR